MANHKVVLSTKVRKEIVQAVDDLALDKQVTRSAMVESLLQSHPKVKSSLKKVA